MNKIFAPENFFDLSNIAFADIFTDVTYVWEALANLHEYILLQFATKKIVSNYGENGNIFLGEGTVVEEGAKIVGPAIIGKNCFIGHATFLRNDCLLGD